MKTTCSKCGNHKEANRNKQRYCKKCHAEHMRNNRKKHSELSDEQRKKATTRAYTNVYIGYGKLIKGKCENCGADKVEAHHDDYNRPLEVRWFCRTCHLEHHANLKHLTA